MSTHLAVDRAHIEACAATNARQRFLELATDQRGATIVHEDHVEHLGAIRLARSAGPRDEIRVYRKRLASG
jgi:hypothetical protein